MNFCKEAKIALLEGVKRGDALQVLIELDQYCNRILVDLEHENIFYLEQLLALTDTQLLVRIFDGAEHRFKRLEGSLNEYHYLQRVPPNTLALDTSGYIMKNFEEARRRAKTRFEQGDYQLWDQEELM